MKSGALIIAPPETGVPATGPRVHMPAVWGGEGTMPEREDREEPLIIASASELLRPTTRRKFVRMMGVGGSIVMLPSVFGACDDDDDPVVPQSPPPPPPPPQSPPPPPPPPPPPVTGVSFDLRNDVGIFRLVHALEIVEAAFYTAVLMKTNFGALFNTDAQEVLVDIRNAEVIHREFLRNALGAQAVPDFSNQLNQTTLSGFLATRESILTTARMLESNGVAGLNGAGKYIKDVRNLLIAGKIVSVEARHLAALRELQPPAGVDANVAFASDETIDAFGRDIKLEAGDVLARVKALNAINEPLQSNITITNAPDPVVQGEPTDNFFPPNP